MFGIGTPELIIVAIVGLLLFGKRLPEVARNLGKGITEFKKGVRGLDEDSDTSSYSSNSRPSSRPVAEDRPVETTAPKFEPPKFEPNDTSSSAS
ncbi:MAG: twin-arginine translocase TatA/TatE family subunit [Planctomycetaceae bacterium]